MLSVDVHDPNSRYSMDPRLKSNQIDTDINETPRVNLPQQLTRYTV